MLKQIALFLPALGLTRVSAGAVQHPARQVVVPTPQHTGPLEPIVTITTLIQTLPPTRTTRTTLTTTTRPTTTTSSISTPRPTQPGMIAGCDQFYKVKSGERFDVIGPRFDVTCPQLLAWNPSVEADCSGIWADVYLCVSVIGHTGTPPNAIETPVPVIPGLPNNCNRFAQIASGQRCEALARDAHLTLDQLLAWNPRVGRGCSTWYDGFYVCIGIIGFVPPATPALPPNGVATPLPVQEGIASNCKSFHYVQEAQNCVDIARRYGISVSDFVKWNPGVGGDCTLMWANSYVCVALL